VSQNRFDEFKVKMPVYVYGCGATLVSDSKIIIMGGFNEKDGNSKAVFTIDLNNGNIDKLNDMRCTGWTVNPIYYSNGVLNMFSTCEETDGLPDHVIYKINVPLIN
jgi:hypothetical protein